MSNAAGDGLILLDFKCDGWILILILNVMDKSFCYWSLSIMLYPDANGWGMIEFKCAGLILL